MNATSIEPARPASEHLVSLSHHSYLVFVDALPRPTCAGLRHRKSRFLLWGWLVESRFHLIFLDALCRITALSEVLLFCAVAHHSQMDNRPGLFGVFLDVLRLRFVGHREILCVGGFGLAPATLGDHPTRPRRRVSGSESTQAIALGSAHCDPKLPLLQRDGRDATIALIRDSHAPFIAPLTEGLDRRRPIRQRGKFGGRLRDLGGKELPQPPEEALRPARLASG